jgi:hypothetical protein
MKPMYKVLLCGSERLPVGLYDLYKATPEQLCRLHYSPVLGDNENYRRRQLKLPVTGPRRSCGR